jgi:plasmid stabilization system protein ParE
VYKISQTHIAKKLNGLIKKAVALVAAHPHIGRRTNIRNVRIKLVRDYLIFYQKTEEQISIWDNRRNPEDIPY